MIFVFNRIVNHFVTQMLLFTLFQHLVVIGWTSTIPENTYHQVYTELTRPSILEIRTIESQDFEYDPLGLNFEPDRPKDQIQLSNVPDEEWASQFPVFQWTNKPTDPRIGFESIPRMLTTSYESNFRQRYAQLLNYSEIFENCQKKTFTKSARSLQSANYSFSSFPSLTEIYGYLGALEKLSEGRAIVVPLQYNNGTWNNVHTNFGNEILSIRISPTSASTHEQNPIIVVVAGIHASDWYAVQSALFVSTELILNANRTIRHDLDWWIIPVLNPDGYEITHAGAEWRDWKKNLDGTKDANSEKCFGVDLDLNFEYQWLPCNYSVCDSNFPGKFPFTVPETRGLRDTLEAFDNYCDYFVALKEGKQLLVFPFSDTLDNPRNVDSINEISKAALEAFQKHVEGTYEYGQSSHLIDIGAGFIEDWAKVHLGVEKSFAFYLGPTEKDRRELKAQHLMDHMNGIFDLLEVIASSKIDEKASLNSSTKIYISSIYIILNIFIIKQKYVFP